MSGAQQMFNWLAAGLNALWVLTGYQTLMTWKKVEDLALTITLQDCYFSSDTIDDLYSCFPEVNLVEECV